MANLNPQNVPASLQSLIEVAERWGIGDDFERQAAIENASLEELNSLVHSIYGITDDDFYGWLAGPDSYLTNPSDEYVALSNLAMAIDSARTRLQRLQG